MGEPESANSESGTSFDTHDFHRLFPFPPSLCDNMDLLELLVAPNDQPFANHLDPIESWPVDHTAFDFTWMDLFEMNFENADMEGGVR